MVKKNYQYRLYPTKAQTTKLNNTLETCRFVWNRSRWQRKNAYQIEQKSVSKFDQNNELKSLKKENSKLKEVHSQVLQNVNERIDLAFRAFFQRLKRKETPGYPRYKEASRFKSFCYPQTGFRVQNNKVFLSKIGHVRFVEHRPVPTNIKRLTIKKSSTGKWYAVFCCEVEPQQLEELNDSVGIDVGVKSFATFSDGLVVENPKFFKRDSKELTKAQRKHSKKKSPKTQKVVNRIHERIKFRRDNFSHQTSREVVNKYNPICIEDLDINRIKRDSYRVLNREISDAAWTSFTDKLVYKAEEAGRQVVKVNPAYTSQDCSSCGYRVQKKLSDRVHICPSCGLKLDRDVNAALNILALGIQGLAKVNS